MHDVRDRGGPRGEAGKRPDYEPLDDWLGDLSDDDWDEGAAERAAQPSAAPARRERRTPEPTAGGAPPHARRVDTAARRAGDGRRTAVAAAVVLLLGALGAAAAVLLVRDGEDASGSTVAGFSTVSTPTSTDTDTVTTPSTTPTTTTPTTPSETATTFTLPEGTKLQRGESTGDSDLTVSTDPALVRELQRALVAAGYAPGTPDGIFGLSTERAVVAFQQANGLTPDGIVGPATADALNSAIAGG